MRSAVNASGGPRLGTAPRSASCRPQIALPSARRGYSSAMLLSTRRGSGTCRATSSDSNDGEDSTESLFEKELRKRGLGGSAVKSDDRDAEDDQRSPMPQFRQLESNSSGQLERSRRLNSEGLEGLIPRLTELVKLGGSFWVAFYPLIGLVIVAFALLYLGIGSGFIHQGDMRMAVPDYLDPSLLLDDPEPEAARSNTAAPSIHE